MATQFELFEIKNPCIGVCQSNKRGYCFGCLRSRKERQLWLQMDNQQRREVLRLIARRKQRIRKLKQNTDKPVASDIDAIGAVSLPLDFDDSQ